MSACSLSVCACVWALRAYIVFLLLRASCGVCECVCVCVFAFCAYIAAAANSLEIPLSVPSKRFSMTLWPSG